jgi:hypothetical protein
VLQLDESGRFSGSFNSIKLDSTKPHALRVILEDREGVRKAIYRLEGIDIRIPG